MLSQYPLNPNAQSYYSTPNNQVFYDPRFIHHYVPPSNLGVYPPSPFPFPCDQNVKTVQVWARVRGRKLLAENNARAKPLGNRAVPFPNTVQEAKTSSITTVMIRNIPNQFKFEDLQLILDEHCFKQNKSAEDPKAWSKFDFVYLPMDYGKHAIEKKKSNLGYAFVNFTTPAAAFKFYSEFQGFEWDVAKNKKICEINVAQYQEFCKKILIERRMVEGMEDERRERDESDDNGVKIL
uniref:Mei2-like C-terminal RNA recognition motif domain-containing protein n=1 Tax=Glycine max TaxID=3847 RepID=A0A0R0GV62_SOYBN